VDKCQVCYGVGMLVDVASLHTMYNARDTAQLLRGSRWNLRDLRLELGDGTDVTMFASINLGWSSFNREDMLRISSDKWKPHLLNLLKHAVIQGIWTKGALQERYNQEGPYDLTSMAGEAIRVDTQDGTLTVAGGKLSFSDIRGVDGLVHFTDQALLPRSATQSVYDVGNESPIFSTQVLYFDTLQLTFDVERLSPLTVLFAPNAAWEGISIPIDEVGNSVLKNHMFNELVWCESLREMALEDQKIVSMNQQTWTITVNEGNFPCFQSINPAEGSTRTCITQCDIMARNGIVHVLDETPVSISPPISSDAPTVAPVLSPSKGCFSDLSQVADRVATKNAFQVETYILCPNTVYKIGFIGASGVTEDGFPALVLRQNTRYICGEDGKSSNNCILTGGQFQLLSTFNSFNQEIKANIQIKGITFQDGESAGALLVAPGDVIFEDCIFRVSFTTLHCLFGPMSNEFVLFPTNQAHSNFGAVSLLYFVGTGRRLLHEMNNRMLLTEQARVQHEIAYYTNLLKDPQAMEEFRNETQYDHCDERNLQMDDLRQRVTFSGCKFESNTYGENSTVTNYGAIAAESKDNDLVVRESIFLGNMFGDKSIVVNSVLRVWQ